LKGKYERVARAKQREKHKEKTLREWNEEDCAIEGKSDEIGNSLSKRGRRSRERRYFANGIMWCPDAPSDRFLKRSWARQLDDKVSRDVHKSGTKLPNMDTGGTIRSIRLRDARFRPLTPE
jgi:hypothetical protein